MTTEQARFFIIATEHQKKTGESILDYYARLGVPFAKKLKRIKQINSFLKNVLYWRKKKISKFQIQKEPIESCVKLKAEIEELGYKIESSRKENKDLLLKIKNLEENFK